MTLEKDDRIQLDGELVTVVAVTDQIDGLELVVKSPSRGLVEAFVRAADVGQVLVNRHDGSGNPDRALTALWAAWMQWAIPRIRSAVLATRPLRPYAHQDEAVFSVMLPQPRLRFLLADEPGTGKTLMAGMYIAEGRRRGLIPGKVAIVVPAHLVTKWIRDLDRFLGIQAHPITAEIGREPLDLRDDIDVWVVSIDLYTYNSDVRRKVVGSHASWSLAVFDEAHRLTPTAQYLGAADQLARKAHHLLLLTATPHRGKEHFFRALLHLLDPALYPWEDSHKDYGGNALRPGRDNFIRRMKEDLKGFDGEDLFPPRFTETRPVPLTAFEADAYETVMSYVDQWYGPEALLAKSVYGKRAASSLIAAQETLRRRADVLSGTQAGRVAPVIPPGFEEPGFAGADVDSDEAWESAEEAVLLARSEDRSGELQAVKGVLEFLERVQASVRSPAKWEEAKRILAKHEIHPGPGGDQLLVFTEFTDTARWLVRLSREAGYSAELLEGGADQRARDELQQRFLNGQFQVLVSTDAGGEGIDLQSANVMIDWDIPWSLVRLEQRGGRLHRIGQTRPVFLYHLLARETREGRVQEVMLSNLASAAEALRGRIFDLMDATAERAGFDFTAALQAAQRGGDAVDEILRSVPDTEVLIQRAREIAAEEDRLKTPVNTSEALTRFAADRLQAINPVIVNAFLDQVARSSGWSLSTGPVTGIHVLRATSDLPSALCPGRECLVAADAAVVARAKAEDFRRASDVVILGPTEDSFRSLVEHAHALGEADLLRGAGAVDGASLTDYTLFLYEAEIEYHDGIRRGRRPVPLLIRYSGAGAFSVAWESLMNLRALGDSLGPPVPAASHEGDAAARKALEVEANRVREDQRAVTSKTRGDLDDIERRYKRQVRHLPAEARREAVERFEATKQERLEQLARIEDVALTAPSLVGWVQVHGGAKVDHLGYDPNSEKVAIGTVVSELERLGWAVDDRQTAGLGYDLFARRPGTSDQRLVEVKGFAGDLEAVTLEQHEWGQAQQRGNDYWLYVVVDCATTPRVVVRLQHPAGALASGPKLIERFQIPVSRLRELMEGM